LKSTISFPGERAGAKEEGVMLDTIIKKRAEAQEEQAMLDPILKIMGIALSLQLLASLLLITA
jgi:hypothetical protein